MDAEAAPRLRAPVAVRAVPCPTIMDGSTAGTDRDRMKLERRRVFPFACGTVKQHSFMVLVEELVGGSQPALASVL